MRCVLRTPEADLFDGEVRMTVLIATDGELGILPGHAPMLAALGTGACRLKTGDGVRTFAISGGFSRVRGDVVTILTTRCEPGHRIDRDAAKEALAEVQGREARDIEERETKRRDIIWARARLEASVRNTAAPPPSQDEA